MANVKLDDMMRKISGLLAVADDPATPVAAADTYRAQAEKLRRKYAIEEEELRQSGALNSELITPVARDIVLCPADSPYYNVYWNLFVYTANHADIRYKSGWLFVDGQYSLVAHVVGFESDIRFAELLYTTARIVFADRMEPKVDPSLSDEDNVYRMRSAGIERIKIADRMGYGKTNSATSKVTRLYKKACAERGEEATHTGRDFNVAAFREEYGNGFISEYWNRLYKAKNGAYDGGGKDIVLAGRREAVDEAFYERYPSMRPKAAIGNKGKTRSQAAREYRMTAADRRRMERASSKAGRAGTMSGREAAKEVDLGGSTKPREL